MYPVRLLERLNLIGGRIRSDKSTRGVGLGWRSVGLDDYTKSIGQEGRRRGL